MRSSHSVLFAAPRPPRPPRPPAATHTPGRSVPTAVVPAWVEDNSTSLSRPVEWSVEAREQLQHLVAQGEGRVYRGDAPRFEEALSQVLAVDVSRPPQGEAKVYCTRFDGLAIFYSILHAVAAQATRAPPNEEHAGEQAGPAPAAAKASGRARGRGRGGGNWVGRGVVRVLEVTRKTTADKRTAQRRAERRGKKPERRP